MFNSATCVRGRREVSALKGRAPHSSLMTGVILHAHLPRIRAGIQQVRSRLFPKKDVVLLFKHVTHWVMSSLMPEACDSVAGE